jgi:predicted kinase
MKKSFSSNKILKKECIGMNAKKVFLLSGPPGSGKSTFARKHMGLRSKWASRDNVRFSLLEPGDDYFSREDEVFETFINLINDYLNEPEVEEIYIDATHLTRRSRNLTLRKVDMQNVSEVNCICFTTPLDICLVRNSFREGRARVPEDVIKKMYNSIQTPTKEEKFTHIYTYDENDNKREVNING